MNLTDLQIQIIKLLKSYKPLTLASIAKKLDFSKSSILYQLDPLVEQKILIKKQLSPKKITYQLASEKDIKALIEEEKSKLELLLTNKEIEGLDAYKELLNMVANGDDLDTVGYGNIKSKIISELETILEKFRDKVAATGRKDRFTVPDYPENIALLKDHFRKPEWKKTFIGRVIPKELMDVDCDIYVWDGNVGICSFSDNKFKVTIYNDRITYQIYKSLLEILFKVAKEV